MRAHFGLSQPEMAYLLGGRRARMAQVETGIRPLPTIALPRLRALEAASQAPPAPLPAPDLAPLRTRLAQLQAQALRLQLRLTYELPPRAAAAHARLAAADSLPAAEAEAPLPPRAREDQLAQLVLLRNHARAEWDERSGPVPTAALRARLAGLHAEADALAEELAQL